MKPLPCVTELVPQDFAAMPAPGVERHARFQFLDQASRRISGGIIANVLREEVMRRAIAQWHSAYKALPVQRCRGG
jgi:hypothetical protein